MRSFGAAHVHGRCLCGADDVSVTGTVLREWKALCPGARMEAKIVVAANNVAVLNQRKAAVAVSAADKAHFHGFWQHHTAAPLRGRNAIIASICPQVLLHNVDFIEKMRKCSECGECGEAPAQPDDHTCELNKNFEESSCKLFHSNVGVCSGKQLRWQDCRCAQLHILPPTSLCSDSFCFHIKIN